MTLEEFLKQNKIKMTNKGKRAFLLAVKDVYPNLSFTSDTLTCFELIKTWDLPKLDLIKIMSLSAKYSKLYTFA